MKKTPSGYAAACAEAALIARRVLPRTAWAREGHQPIGGQQLGEVGEFLLPPKEAGKRGRQSGWRARRKRWSGYGCRRCAARYHAQPCQRTEHVGEPGLLGAVLQLDPLPAGEGIAQLPRNGGLFQQERQKRPLLLPRDAYLLLHIRRGKGCGSTGKGKDGTVADCIDDSGVPAAAAGDVATVHPDGEARRFQRVREGERPGPVRAGVAEEDIGLAGAGGRHAPLAFAASVRGQS